MPIGDGIRRNIAHVSQEERDRFRDAIIELQNRLYPGARDDMPLSGGVSYWFKQDEIHQATHVHQGPAFLPWHRELCNRFEELLREVDPDLSLHYWDWNDDPRAASDGLGGVVDLFTNTFMGAANGDAGDPWLSADLYDPDADPFRSDDPFDPVNNNPADPPRTMTRSVDPGAPAIGSPGWPTDADIVAAADFPTMRNLLEDSHDRMHGYIGGTIGNAHTAFRDPFVFLLHSNVDRLFAMWQTVPGEEWRLDPDEVYGSEENTTGTNGILSTVEPWAGNPSNDPIVDLARPWAPPENQQVVKNSRHPSIVLAPCYDTLPLSVELTFPIMGAPITFNDVPEGATTVRAAVFSIRSCMPLHFEVVNGPGAGFSVAQPLPVPVPPSVTLVTEGRVWFAHTGTTVGSIANGNVTIRCIETEQEWDIPITANTVAWPTDASMFVLDKSGSMEWDSGIPGQQRVDVLKFAAPIFIDLMPDNNAVGMVAFDHDAMPAMPVTVAGPPLIGAGRIAAKTAITNHTPNPAGGTSIGDGLELAHNIIDPVGGFDHKSLIVLTDGHETAAKYLSDPSITGLINERVYAIGLGTPEKLNPAALSTLADSTGGFLMMTGDLGINDIFRLSKYYLQILAGVTNAQIVVDPESSILPKQVHRIPFQLTETDFRSDVILLSPAPWAFDFALETPDGDIIDPGNSGGLPNVTFVTGDGVHYYRMSLPAPIGNGAREGTWNALLKVDDGNFREYLSTLRQREDKSAIVRARAHGVPYSLSIHARSNLRMDVNVLQESLEPGGIMRLRALVTEYDRPVENRARVSVEIERPDSTETRLTLAEVEPGVFEGQMTSTMSGVYHLLFRSAGKTTRGLPFTREEIRTAAVWKGGDTPSPTSQGDPRGRDEDLCRLLECLFNKETLGGFYDQFGIDPDRVMKCIRRFCAERLAPPAEGPRRNLQQISPAVNDELRDLIGPAKASELMSLLDEVISKSQ